MNDTLSHIDEVMQQVISSSKAAAGQGQSVISADTLARFIACQPGVDGPIGVSGLGEGSAKVGASSGILLFTATYQQDGQPVERDLVLRYSPHNSPTRLFRDYDILSQFRIQRALHAQGIRTPEALWVDAEGDLLGVRGFVMARTKGESPTPSPFTSGILAEAGEYERSRMLEDLIAGLVSIHEVNVQSAGLGNQVMPFSGDTPLARYANWFWRTWEWIEPDAGDTKRLRAVRDWLIGNEPQGGPSVLMHGDPGFANYLFDKGRLKAILDWELSSLGRRELDVAIQINAIDFFNSATGSRVPGAPTEAEWVALYERLSGVQLQDMTYFKRFANYMILIVFYSQNRNLPVSVRAEQRRLADYFWQGCEGGLV